MVRTGLPSSALRDYRSSLALFEEARGRKRMAFYKDHAKPVNRSDDPNLFDTPDGSKE